jgi:hypothetical protein
MRRGSTLLETVMLAPVLLALLVGTISLARVTYTYYMLHKVMFNLARYLGTQQGANLCNPEDAALVAAVNYALTGTTDTADNPVVPGLTPAMFRVRAERYDAATEQMVECECSAAGCDASQGGRPPGFIVVSLVDGYTVSPVFWGFSVSPFPLRPAVRVPYGGT